MSAGSPLSRPILVIDDDRVLRGLFEWAFADDGWPVISAADGVSGLRLAEQAAPALVVLDVVFDRKPLGAAIGTALRARFDGEVPIVVISASREAPAIARQIGAEAVVAKPFDLDEVLALVRRLMQRAPQAGIA